MYNINKLLSLALFAVIFLVSCSTNTTYIYRNDTVVNYVIKQGKPLPPKEWHCYNVEEEKICIPSSWRFVNQNRFFFLAKPPVLDSQSFVVVLKYNIKATGLTVNKYLRETYLQLRNDTIEKFNGYTTLKMVYSNKEAYNSEYHTTIKNKPYTTFSTVFEKDSILFEIALKAEKSQSAKYQQLYQDIVFNFYTKNKLVFTVKDKVNQTHEVDLSKL
jgi:hypothetical protein